MASLTDDNAAAVVKAVIIILIMNETVHQDTTDRVCDMVKIIKQETTYFLWKNYNNFLSKQYWKKHIFWSDGYFACSIGEVSSATIQRYIKTQG